MSQHLGIKEITLASLPVADETTLLFIQDREKWVAWFHEPQLEMGVPENIRRMFEIARGTMLYGWYYYPLLAVGQDQCFRVLEAAARTAYAQLSGLTVEVAGNLPYHAVLKRLVIAKAISSSDSDRWEIAREIRNTGAHATGASIFPPGPVVSDMRVVVDQINMLFKDNNTSAN